MTRDPQARPRRFAVIGSPILHSKSPVMHARAYEALGLPHRYEARDVAAVALGEAIEDLRRGIFDGYNVTAPHKVSVLALVDAVDASAALPGCANTLVRGEGGALTAVNTDVPALASELAAFDVATTSAGPWLVLGTGGAARAAVVALAAHRGVSHVVLRGRRSESAELQAFAQSMHPNVHGVRVSLEPLHANEDDARFAGVIQATSAPSAVADAVSWKHLSDSAIAFDVVYAGGTTPFLERAALRGLRHSGGLGMLVRQGALAFERWLGLPAPLEAMRAAVTP